MKIPTWLQVIWSSLNIGCAAMLGAFIGCTGGIVLPYYVKSIPGKWATPILILFVVVGMSIFVMIAKRMDRRNQDE